MDRERLKRAAWVGALGIALVVVIALVSGRGSGPGAAQIEPLGPQQLPPVPSAGPAQSIDARSVPPSLIRTATATVIQHVDDKTGTLKRTFIADKLTPRERWEMDVVRPQVLLYLSPSRVIHLVSDAGHFVAPANIPQSGQFTGNLVLTIYDSGSSRPARISEDSDDAVIRLESAEGAVFDATRGEVRIAGPVRFFTPNTEQAQLTGRGLHLVYNEVAQRIDRLTIDSVDVLRLRPRDSQMAGRDDKPRPSPDSPGRDEPEEAQRTFYRISFDRQVQVRSADESIEADRMEAYVAMESTGESATPHRRRTSSDTAAGQPAGDAVPPAPEASRTIEITGGGRLVMEPAPLPLDARDMDEFFLRFTGEVRPVRATLQRSMRLTAQRLDYLDTGRTVIAVGSDLHPLRLSSPELGELAALRLVLGLDEGAGRLEGPGSIRAVESEPQQAQTAGPRRALPPGFEVSWSNSVHFTFDALEEATDPLLRSVIFMGGVRMTHAEPLMRLRAEQVTAHFTPVDHKAELAMVDAVGAVHVESDQGAAEAGKLWMEFHPDGDGDPRPRRLKAEGSARFVSGDEGIAGDWLDITFREDKTEPSSDEPRDRFSADVATVTARGNVRLMRKDLRVFCDRLDADQVSGTASLVGAVTVERHSAEQAPFKLSVERLDLDQNRKTALAPGSGALTFTRAGDASRGEQRPVPTTVTWKQRLSYDDAAGLIHVIGSVRAHETKSATETHTLAAQQLTLELVDRQVVAETSDPQARAGQDLLDADLSNRQVKRLVARQNVEVEAWEMDTAHPGRRLWQFKLLGPRLEYTVADDLTRIIGPGKMLIMDSRPQSPRPDDAPAGDAGPLSQVSGRGNTLFTWRKELAFDKINARMVLDQEVEMTHTPASDRQMLISLFADRLTAQAMDPDKVEVIGMEVGSLKVESVEAVGRVQIDHGDLRINAQQVHYDGGRELITLRGRPGDPVQVTNIRSPQAMRGRVILWDLRTGRREVLEPGT